MNTVYRGEPLIDCEKFRRDNEEHSFQNSPDKIRQWILKLRGTTRIFEGNEGQLFHEDYGVFDILDLIEKMLAEDPKERPLVAKVCKSLHMLNSGVNCYFGQCCVERPENCEEYYPLLEAYPQLLLKYKKVKGLYFDGLARRETLEKQLIDAGITPIPEER